MNKQNGFTLVELAIVLAIMGLIMGMAFKGRDLIDTARIKNIQAQHNKVLASFNIYYEKYGAYPGDGCSAAETQNNYADTRCSADSVLNNPRNGVISTAAEASAAMILLRNANILAVADIQSVFGQPWTISPAGAAAGNFAANTNYLTIVSTQTNAADLRLICQLDRVMDDGDPSTGIVRSSAASGNGGGQYNSLVDCWSLDGLAALGMRVLP